MNTGGLQLPCVVVLRPLGHFLFTWIPMSRHLWSWCGDCLKVPCNKRFNSATGGSTGGFSSVLPGAEQHNSCQAHCQHSRSRSGNASFRLTTWRHEQGINNYNVPDKGLTGHLWSPQRRGHVFRGRHRRRHSHFHFDQRHQSEESLGEAERRCQCQMDRAEWRRWDNLQCAQEVLQSQTIRGGRKR